MKNVISQSLGLDLVIINVYATVYRSVLFLLFINDLPLFTNKAYIGINADDTTVHAADKGSKIVKKKKLQTGTNGYLTWCLSNQMFINVLKTFVMTIGT